MATIEVKCVYEWIKLASAAVHVQHLRCYAGGKEQEGGKSPMGFLIIPGNPGCIQFYERFAEVLVQRCSSSVAPLVLGVSHTGHARHPAHLPHPPLDECGLERQIAHKVAYVREIGLERCERVILIGHSIGCYIILHLLERLTPDERRRVAKSVLLFPTIERMSATPNGKRLTPLLSKARWAALLMACTVASLPKSFVDRILPFFVKTNDECVKNAVTENLLHVSVANASTFMGLEEMHMVQRRDDDIISRHLADLIFYYGSRDDWCPQEYYRAVLDKFGSDERARIMLCDAGMDHAFVLNQSQPVAELVASWSNPIIQSATCQPSSAE